MWCLATFAQQWSHMTAFQSVMNVRVTLLSEPGKLPYLLQARAERPFGKGELVLTPYGGELQLRRTTDMGTFSPDAKVLHESLPASAVFSVWGHSSAPGRARQTLPGVSFVLGSPLFQGKAQKSRETCYANLAPFWAVARCGRAQARTNSMIYGYTTFDVPSPKPHEGLKWPTETKKWHARIPVLRNVKKLVKGDLLSLPFFDEGEYSA